MQPKALRPILVSLIVVSAALTTNLPGNAARFRHTEGLQISAPCRDGIEYDYWTSSPTFGELVDPNPFYMLNVAYDASGSSIDILIDEKLDFSSGEGTIDDPKLGEVDYFLESSRRIDCDLAPGTRVTIKLEPDNDPGNYSITYTVTVEDCHSAASRHSKQVCNRGLLTLNEFGSTRSKLSIDAPGRISNLNLEMALFTDDVSRLEVTLIAPSAREALLFDRNSVQSRGERKLGEADDRFILDDEGHPNFDSNFPGNFGDDPAEEPYNQTRFKPIATGSEKLSAFDGTVQAGEWTLEIENGDGKLGTLLEWCLNYAIANPAAVEVQKTVGTDPTSCSQRRGNPGRGR